MKRLIILVALLAAGALSIVAAGYQQPSQGLPAAALAATQIEKVKDNLYMITGADPTDRNSFSGGNTGVFITVVCDEYAGVTAAERIAIRRIRTGDHVQIVFNFFDLCRSQRRCRQPLRWLLISGRRDRESARSQQRDQDS